MTSSTRSKSSQPAVHSERATAAAIFGALLILAASLSGGCFSGLARSGSAWSGGQPSTSTKVKAGIADAVTLPIQAPVLILAGAAEASSAREQAEKERMLQEITTNPEVIFEKKIHLSKKPASQSVIAIALWRPEIPFTDAQLRRLYAELEDARKCNVVIHPNCSIAFLEEVRAGLPRFTEWERTEHIERMCRNPSVPDSWLEAWAGSPDSTSLQADTAKRALERRLWYRAKARPGGTPPPAPSPTP